MLEESIKTIRTGEIVEGTVIDVKPEEIILNIGYKSDGVLTRQEYSNENNLDLTTAWLEVNDSNPWYRNHQQLRTSLYHRRNAYRPKWYGECEPWRH